MKRAQWILMVLAVMVANLGVSVSSHAATTRKTHDSTKSCPLAQGRAIDQEKVLSETNSKNKQEADSVKTQSAK